MVVPLTAVTENVTLPFNKTVWFVGWTEMTGAGPVEARHGIARKQQKTRQIAAVFNCRIRNSLLLHNTTKK